MYDSVIGAPRVLLGGLTWADLHDIIRDKKELPAAAEALGVDPRTISAHLAKFGFRDGSPVSVEKLVSMTPREARAEFGEGYDLEAPCASIQNLTWADVHPIIRDNKILTAAATALGVRQSTLRCHLDKFRFKNGSPVSVEKLVSMTPEEARTEFGEGYDRKMVPPRVSLQSLTWADVHAAILDKKELTAAAEDLRVDPNTLSTHLGKFRLRDGSSVSFERLLSMTPGEAHTEFGDGMMVPPHVSLESLTWVHVHTTIRDTIGITAAAEALKVDPRTLRRHLEKFSFRDGSSVSFERLASISAKRARTKFGEGYDGLMVVPHVPLQSLTLAQVHAVIFEKKKFSPAAAKLRVHSNALRSHLKKFRFRDGSSVSFAKLASLTAEQARTKFGEGYDSMVGTPHEQTLAVKGKRSAGKKPRSETNIINAPAIESPLDISSHLMREDEEQYGKNPSASIPIPGSATGSAAEDETSRLVLDLDDSLNLGEPRSEARLSPYPGSPATKSGLVRNGSPLSFGSLSSITPEPADTEFVEGYEGMMDTPHEQTLVVEEKRSAGKRPRSETNIINIPAIESPLDPWSPLMREYEDRYSQNASDFISISGSATGSAAEDELISDLDDPFSLDEPHTQARLSPLMRAYEDRYSQNASDFISIPGSATGSAAEDELIPDLDDPFSLDEPHTQARLSPLSMDNNPGSLATRYRFFPLWREPDLADGGKEDKLDFFLKSRP